jgi:hypothetical protein
MKAVRGCGWRAVVLLRLAPRWHQLPTLVATYATASSSRLSVPCTLTATKSDGR